MDKGFLRVIFGLCLWASLVYGQAKQLELEHAFDLHLQLGKPTDVGKIGPIGSRRLTPVIGGTVEGRGLKGKILPGVDYQIIRPDGGTEIDAHYVVQTESGDLLYIINRGIRRGPADVLQRLNAGEKVDQSLIYFRTVLSLETAAPTLQWMNDTVFVGVGERLPNEAIVRVFRVN
ncbi:MAG: DUF3237 domain-containing protein [Acidobacteriia bacterium]|nr:DUF3237 domain-containing protein [Terriglobia bacterium]